MNQGLGGVEGVCEGRMRDQVVRLASAPQGTAGELPVGQPGPWEAASVIHFLLDPATLQDAC